MMTPTAVKGALRFAACVLSLQREELRLQADQ
jgi:hypothetical protein